MTEMKASVFVQCAIYFQEKNTSSAFWLLGQKFFTITKFFLGETISVAIGTAKPQKTSNEHFL